MKYMPSSLILIIAVVILSGCSDRQLLVPYSDNTDKPAYSQNGSAASRAPLDVPPELRGDVEVPEPEKIASQGGSVNKDRVAGQAVSLDGRVYSYGVATVFSATVDAMTALNMPVQSVDSPSGTLTTDWIKKESATSNVSVLSGVFGGETVLAVRYRFVVRVLRQKSEETEVTRLEIRTVGQAFVNRHWVNRPMKRKVADELFAAVEERLPRKITNQ